jgi:DNA-binding transcriptional LysR family regulator
LRVTTTHALGATWIAPLLGEFHARHPQVRVELLLSNDHLDIIAGEIDVALRVGTLADSNLLARKLSVLRAAVYTTPSYIEHFGEPLHPDDLIRHRALAVHNKRNAWTLSDSSGKSHEFPIDPIVIANDPTALRAALLAGTGIMLTTDVWVRAHVEQGQVQRVLTGWRGVDIDLNALFPRGQVQSPKVRAFINFLVERLDIEKDYTQVNSDPAVAPRLGKR